MEEIMLSNHKKSIVLFLICLILLLEGCALHKIQMNSIELPSQVTCNELANYKIAILPAVGRVISKKQYSTFTDGYQSYITHTQESDNLVNCDEVEKTIMSNPELLNDYKNMVNGLKGYDKEFKIDNKDSKYTVNNSEWNGTEGIKYENVLSTYKNMKGDASKLRINWNINLKTDAKKHELLSSSRRLSESLGCDYLLVPVLIDNYNYSRGPLTIFFIPFAYVFNLRHSSDLALYLIDGQSGEIISASLGKQLTSTLSAASLQRILCRGDFMGSLKLEERR